MKSTLALGLIASTLFTSSVIAEESKLLFKEAGFRFGVEGKSHLSLTSYEVFSTIDAPWSWELTDSVTAELNFEAALGALHGHGETAAYARFAPALEISFGDFPVSIIASSGPSVYSEDTYGDYDMGGNFHFTSSFGFEWDCCENWTISYRFQHTSNADLGDPNPGLDLHTFGIAYSY